MKRLLPDDALWNSSVVANSTMNRERGLEGVNSYARELRLHPVAYLREVLETSGTASWLDLCCGSGKAILEAARQLNGSGLSDRVHLRGVDLVAMFYPIPFELNFARLEQGALPDWEPQETFDLITCVHGLHYIGDKLQLLKNVTEWLNPSGRFIAHFDPVGIQVEGEPDASRTVMKILQVNGFQYNSQTKMFSGSHLKRPAFGYEYIGADDGAGPNYTGQATVTSYYRTP